jgi:hypothetical protein
MDDERKEDEDKEKGKNCDNYICSLDSQFVKLSNKLFSQLFRNCFLQ